MRFQIRFKEFSGVRSPGDHPLLGLKTLRVSAVLADSSRADIPVSATNTFEINDPDTRVVTVRFTSSLNLSGRVFNTLKIIQSFGVRTSGGIGGDVSLTPLQWFFEFLQEDLHSFARMGQHPLLGYDDSARIITLNVLVIDLTDFWMDAHRNNRWYKLRALVWDKSPVQFRVLAHLGGPPLIWYVSVPVYLLYERKAAPHVFFAPADNTPLQHIHANSGDFGPKDLEYIQTGLRDPNSADSFDKDGPELMTYLLPPLEDEVVASRASDFSVVGGNFALRFRNVVMTSPVTLASLQFNGKPQPRQWDIPCGFERALAGGSRKPRQILMFPQRPDQANNVFALTAHLQQIMDASMNVLWTNSGVVNQDPDSTSLEIDQFVLSCYSQSGVDLWECAFNNQERIKAVIAIEPQNMNTILNKEGNKLGKDIIPILVRKKIAVYVIGRHDTPKYHPQIPDPGILRQVRFKPTDTAILRYPPNPDSNDFVRFRVSRLKNTDSDPLMPAVEKQVFEQLRLSGRSPDEIYSLIFHPEHNRDFSPDPPDAVQRWYTHQFAVSGGQLMDLPKDWKTAGLYGRRVEYKTFFQECVEEIG